MNDGIEKTLFAYRDARREIETIQAKREIIEAEMLPRSPSITGLPKGGGQDDKMGEYMVRLESLQRDLDTAYIKAVEELERINNLIAKVKDASLRQLLTYRYLKGYKWEAIADAMGYSKQWTFKLKKRAFKEITAYIDDGR